MCGDKMNVAHEMCDRTSNNWSHRRSNKVLQKNWEVISAKYSIDLLQKNSYTWNITYSTKGTAG